MTLVAPTLESFFTDRLAKQRFASPRTVASYRDGLRLLLVFVQDRTGTPPAKLDWTALDIETISAFLDHLESERHNSTRTRNLRLTAIRSLFSYASLRHPEHAALIQRVLAMPAKRFDKPIVSFLAGPESTRSSTPPTYLGGREDGIQRCCLSLCRPGYASLSSLALPAATSAWVSAATSAVKARVASTEPSRRLRPPKPSSRCG